MTFSKKVKNRFSLNRPLIGGAIFVLRRSVFALGVWPPSTREGGKVAAEHCVGDAASIIAAAEAYSGKGQTSETEHDHEGQSAGVMMSGDRIALAKDDSNGSQDEHEHGDSDKLSGHTGETHTEEDTAFSFEKLECLGVEVAVADGLSREINEIVARVPGVADLSLEANLRKPQIRVQVNREQIARYGLNADDLMTTIGNQLVSTLIDRVKRFGISARLQDASKKSIEAIRIVLAALILAVVPVHSIAAQQECGTLPLLDDAPKEERIKALFERGADCIRQGKLAQTIATFSEVIGLDPENRDAYINRGTAYLHNRQYELGLADFSHVIRKDPTFVQAWYNRGTAFIVIKQYDSGIADLTEVIRISPKFARAYCNRALGYIAKSDYAKALTDLNTGIKIDSRLPLCYYARGDLRFIRADYQKAVDDFTKSLQLKPGNAAILAKRGEAYERLGERDRALADFESAAVIAPSSKKIKDAIKRLSED